jgi:hypothetical protein
MAQTPVTDATNTCPDGNAPSGINGCTFEEAPRIPIDKAKPPTTVCTEEEVMAGTCVLPDPCTSTDDCWTTPDLVFGGICTLD